MMMTSGRGASTLALAAVPPLVASGLVLTIAAVDSRLWLIQLSAIALAALLASLGHQVLRLSRGATAAPAIVLLTLAGVAAPLVRAGPGPHRWAAIGPLSLYLAPVLLPSFFAGFARCAARCGRMNSIAFAAAVGVALLLATQPDASQVLALLAGMAIVCVRYRLDPLRSGVTLAAIGLIAAWAFSRPDPLEPVPYVEGVFALTLAHSLAAGLAAVAGAVALIVGLALWSSPAARWLSAVAAYYAVLFACSVAGLTPAPLIGYGAGPVLGFGLMVAVHRFDVSPFSSSLATAARAPGRPSRRPAP
ncbi:MAG: hypothetical protein ABIT71_26085 [Vicinamibacteraceae bacterium]